jgi:hypothetical protein
VRRWPRPTVLPISAFRFFPLPHPLSEAKNHPQRLSGRSSGSFLPPAGRDGWQRSGSRSCMVDPRGRCFPHHVATGWQENASSGSLGYKERLFATGQTHRSEKEVQKKYLEGRFASSQGSYLPGAGRGSGKKMSHGLFSRCRGAIFLNTDGRGHARRAWPTLVS